MIGVIDTAGFAIPLPEFVCMKTMVWQDDRGKTVAFGTAETGKNSQEYNGASFRTLRIGGGLTLAGRDYLPKNIKHGPMPVTS